MQAISQNFGIYLHVPFCAQNCDYCRFYKRAPSMRDIDDYVETITSELKFRAAENGGNLPRPDTLFWGGGTPSTLPNAQLERLARLFDGELSPSQEWTVEVAPTSATKEKLQILKDCGATRISMGVQSFNTKTLTSLGRKHTAKATMEAIERVAQVGFANFSIDLIFGAKDQTADEWIDDLRRAAAQPVNHISAYCLEFESATSVCAGAITDAEAEKRASDADFFETAMELLPELGFSQYEISNYARSESAQCLHNLSTWHMAQWLGVGAAAASQWRGVRSRNTPDFAKWRSGILAGAPNCEDIVNLDDEEMFSSALIFGLRMNRGVNFDDICRRFPRANADGYWKSAQRLQDLELLDISAAKEIVLTRNGRLMADSVAVELMGV